MSDDAERVTVGPALRGEQKERVVEARGELAELRRIVRCVTVSPRQAERAGQSAEAADGDVHGEVRVVDGPSGCAGKWPRSTAEGLVNSCSMRDPSQHVGRHAALDDPAELRQALVDQARGDRDLVAQRPAVREVAQDDQLGQVARQLFRVRPGVRARARLRHRSGSAPW